MRLALRNSSKPAAAAAAPAVETGSGAAWDQESSDVFLGSLRSEVDERFQVAEPFERLALVSTSVLRAYRYGRLDAGEAAKRLTLLRLCDDEGTEWIIGATSGLWYRRLHGGVWKVAVPPRQSDEVMSDSATAALVSLAQLDSPEIAEQVRHSDPAENETGTADAVRDASAADPVADAKATAPAAFAAPPAAKPATFPVAATGAPANAPASSLLTPAALTAASPTRPAAPVYGEQSYGDDEGGYGDEDSLVGSRVREVLAISEPIATDAATDDDDETVEGTQSAAENAAQAEADAESETASDEAAAELARMIQSLSVPKTDTAAPPNRRN